MVSREYQETLKDARQPLLLLEISLLPACYPRLDASLIKVKSILCLRKNGWERVPVMAIVRSQKIIGPDSMSGAVYDDAEKFGLEAFIYSLICVNSHLTTKSVRSMYFLPSIPRKNLGK